jgi:DedD protein
MDRRVKERLIGACVLVVLVVAVVPELLSGPKPASPAGDGPPGGDVRLPAAAPDPVRNVTVDLTTAKPALDEAAPVAAPASQTPPGTDAGAAASGAPAVDDAAASTAAASTAAASTAAASTAGAGTMSTKPAPARAVETAPPFPTSSKSYAVQLGSFANRGNAENLVHQLKAQGFSIYMSAEGSGAATRYRVRVGPLADRDAAGRTVAKLKSLGHAAAVVSPP